MKSLVSISALLLVSATTIHAQPDNHPMITEQMQTAHTASQPHSMMGMDMDSLQNMFTEQKFRLQEMLQYDKQAADSYAKKLAERQQRENSQLQQMLNYAEQQRALMMSRMELQQAAMLEFYTNKTTPNDSANKAE